MGFDVMSAGQLLSIGAWRMCNAHAAMHGVQKGSLMQAQAGGCRNGAHRGCFCLSRRESQAAAYELISGWTTEDHNYLRAEVPRTALRTPFRDGTLQDLAKQVRSCTER